jgi:F0F1-type ATP synthase assembly protein I
MKDFSKLCTPSRIYFAIAVIATIFALLNGVSIMMAFTQIIFAFVWTFILGWLCDKGYTSISWFLVLLPYILMALAMLNIYHVTEEQRQIMRAIKLQGAYGQEAMTNKPKNKMNM